MPSRLPDAAPDADGDVLGVDAAGAPHAASMPSASTMVLNLDTERVIMFLMVKVVAGWSVKRL